MELNTQQVITERIYMGYKITPCGKVFNAKGTQIKLDSVTSRSGEKYSRVTLHFKKVRRRYLLHRLMALVFIGDVSGFEVNHTDRNTRNNHIFNLEILTTSENQLHWRKIQKGKTAYDC